MAAEETEMSNPHDDPGHRPPPPRQGEEQQYQGGYAPDQSGYAPGPPPPPHQPGAWQGQSGYDPPPQFPEHQPDYTAGISPARAPRAGKGFFGALLDVNFDYLVTTRLIKISYVLAIVVYSLVAVLMLILTWSFSVWNKPLAVITLIATPVVWVGGLLGTRMVLEFVINQFKITEHLKALRERDGLR